MNNDELIKTLRACKKIIELLHPHLTPEEPCIVWEAYQSVNTLLKQEMGENEK